MQAFASRVRRFLQSEDGPTAVEYAVMLALISVALIAAIQALSGGVKTTFNSATTTLGGTAAS